MPGIWNSRHRLMLWWLVVMQALFPGRKTLEALARWTPAYVTVWRLRRRLKAAYWDVHLLVAWWVEEALQTLPPPKDGTLYLVGDGSVKPKRGRHNPLAQTDRVVVASPAYLTRKGVPSTPADLLEHHGIIYDQHAGGQAWVFRRGTSETSRRIQTRLTLSAAEGVREAVLAGQGYAIASRWMFALELASGDVVPVLQAWSLPPMDLWIIYPSGRLTSAKARTFVNWFGGSRSKRTGNVDPCVNR